eukprot:sb/3466912/
MVMLLSRQFVEMTKSRIEGLLSAFPKLITTDKQHTFIETESVRYVYQPLDKIEKLEDGCLASLEKLQTLTLSSNHISTFSPNVFPTSLTFLGFLSTHGTTRCCLLLSRQFVEMTKSRIEGLLSAFPKLITTDKQHTFIETESVRYVYQPLDKLYIVLVTTKASNILEDLETLRLFARVIPEYCRNVDEKEVSDKVFELIFAFDEIIALGYRESVSLAQIKTYTEMDSHDEKVYQAVRQTQEREAKEEMKKKAKELQRQRMEAQRSGRSPYTTGIGSVNSSTGPMAPTQTSEMPLPTNPTPTPSASRPKNCTNCVHEA